MPYESEPNSPYLSRGYSARMIAALVRPAPVSPPVAAALVAAVTVFFGWAYYALDGTVSLQIFYILPLVLGVSWLGLGGGVAIAVLSSLLRLVGDIANAAPEFFTQTNLVRIASNRFSALLMLILIAVIIHELIILTRQLEHRVQTRSEALRQAVEARARLQNTLFEVSRRERNAIGRDLHDGLGQHLTATAMAANILVKKLGARADPLADDARTVETYIKTGIDQTRQIGRGLLLDLIHPGEFIAELEELASSAALEQNKPCVLTTEGRADDLDENTTSHLFYIAREAVRNALRHGGASRVAIHLSVSRALAALTITDNGIGLPASAETQGGMGLRIMSHRAELMGGQLQIDSPPGGGTRVDCRVPLPVT